MAWATSGDSCCEETLVCCRQDWERTFVSSLLVSGSWDGLLALVWYTQKGTAYLEGAKQALIDAHHGTRIVKLAAIVGGAEKRH